MYLSPVAFEGLLKGMHAVFDPGTCMLVMVVTACNGIYCLPVVLQIADISLTHAIFLLIPHSCTGKDWWASLFIILQIFTNLWHCTADVVGLRVC